MIFTKIRAKLIFQEYQPILKSGQKVLDIGCGDGQVSEYLQKKLKIQLTGTDISDYLKVEIPFEKMPNENILPFVDNQFEFAMFNDVLHHTDLKESLLREALRVANKLLIFELEPSLIAQFVDKFFNKLHYPQMPVPLAFLDYQEWSKLITKLGYQFTISKVRKPFWYPLNHYFITVSKL